MVSKDTELTPKEADAMWEKMDNQGYAGKLGSNKPEATRLVQKAHEGSQPKPVVATTLPSQSSFLPRNPLEGEQTQIAALRPDGTRKPRKSKGRSIYTKSVDELLQARQVPGWDRRR